MLLVFEIQFTNCSTPNTNLIENPTKIKIIQIKILFNRIDIQRLYYKRNTLYSEKQVR